MPGRPRASGSSADSPRCGAIQVQAATPTTTCEPAITIPSPPVFVTAGGENPTSTIQALALYIADQMKQRLATLSD